MRIKVNGDFKEIGENTSIAKLLQIMNVETPEMVSVQVNGKFVDKDLYKTQIVMYNDEVDFLYFLGGGQL